MKWLFHSLHYFLPPIAFRETKSIANIARFIKNVQSDRQMSTAKKKK